MVAMAKDRAKDKDAELQGEAVLSREGEDTQLEALILLVDEWLREDAAYDETVCQQLERVIA